MSSHVTIDQMVTAPSTGKLIWKKKDGVKVWAGEEIAKIKSGDEIPSRGSRSRQARNHTNSQVTVASRPRRLVRSTDWEMDMSATLPSSPEVYNDLQEVNLGLENSEGLLNVIVPERRKRSARQVEGIPPKRAKMSDVLAVMKELSEAMSKMSDTMSKIAEKLGVNME